MQFRASAIAALVGSFALIAAARADSPLTAAQEATLASTPYVYIQSQRADGTMSDPAEIWFLYHQGSVWVGTSPKSWRAKRIRAGRPRAKIAIRHLEGETFWANGAIVDDDGMEKLLLDTFAKKYGDDWGKWEKSFREGFQDGSRILIRYTPTR